MRWARHRQPSASPSTPGPTLLVWAVACAALGADARPDMLECNGLSNRIKGGEQIMKIKPALFVLHPSEAPFQFYRYSGATTSGWTNFALVIAGGTLGQNLAFFIQATDNTTFNDYPDPVLGCGNEAGGNARKVCLKCPTVIYTETWACMGDGCTFGVKSNGTPNMTVLVGWSKGEDDYDPGLVTYTPYDLGTAPIRPPPPPPPLPECTGAARSFCDHSNDQDAVGRRCPRLSLPSTIRHPPCIACCALCRC